MNLPAIAWDLIQAQHRATLEHAERHGHRQRSASPRPARARRTWNRPKPRR